MKRIKEAKMKYYLRRILDLEFRLLEAKKTVKSLRKQNGI